MMDNIQDWLFTYSNGRWRAARREHYRELFNDYNSPNVAKSRNINTLIALISKYGSLEEMKANIPIDYEVE